MPGASSAPEPLNQDPPGPGPVFGDAAHLVKTNNMRLKLLYRQERLWQHEDAGGFFSPRTPEPGTLVRNLNRRNSPQGRLLVSVDLTAGKTSATGGCLRFVPGPALAIWQTKKQTVCAWNFLCRQESSRATEKAGDFPKNKLACFLGNPQPFPCALAHRPAGKAGLPGSGMFSFSLPLRSIA